MTPIGGGLLSGSGVNLKFPAGIGARARNWAFVWRPSIFVDVERCFKSNHQDPLLLTRFADDQPGNDKQFFDTGW